LPHFTQNKPATQDWNHTLLYKCYCRS